MGVVRIGRPAATPGGRAGRREPPPARPPGEAEEIQPARVVVLTAGGEDLDLPRPGGDLVAVELGQDRGQPLQAGDPLVRLDPLPAEQKPEQIARADRLDLGPEPVQGVAVDPRQEPAIAPFQRLGPPCEAAAKDHPLGLEGGQRGVGQRLAHA